MSGIKSMSLKRKGSKSLERIADRAKNIAEEVVYLCEAQDIRHNLKK